LGGSAVTASTVLSQFDELVNLQKRFHKQDRCWADKIVVTTPHNIPSPTTVAFVGRSESLRAINARLQHNSLLAINAIQGMGGVGKTELAIRYALAHLKRSTYSGGILWLDTRDRDVEIKIMQFVEDKFGLQRPDDHDLPDRVAFSWSHWPIKDDVLIVMDDVNDYSKIEPYLPPQPSHFKVLITTRLELGAQAH